MALRADFWRKWRKKRYYKVVILLYLITLLLWKNWSS